MTNFKNIKLSVIRSNTHLHPHNPIEKYFYNLTKYQLFVFACLFLAKIPVSWHVLSLIFLSPRNINFYCNGTTNYDGTNPQDTTVLTDLDVTNLCPCEQPWWDQSVFTETLQTKYNLICKRKWLVTFIESMFYFGLLVGSMALGYLSDRYGRLLTYVMSCALLCVSGSMVPLAFSVEGYVILRWIEGIATGGAVVISYVLCIEYCGARQRETVTALFHIPFNIGHVSIAGVSYLVRNCDHFMIAISIPVVLTIPFYCILMESPKWLLDNGQVEKAVEVMEKVCKFNGKSCDAIVAEVRLHRNSHGEASTNNTKKASILDIIKNRQLLVSLLCMSVNYFVCGMGYYGVSQYIGNMNSNIHSNVALSGAILLPATLASVFLLPALSRRCLLASSNASAGVFVLAAAFAPDVGHMPVIFACFGNAFFFLSFIVVFLYGVELFPTAVRNSVLGLLSTISRLGQISGPPVNSLPQFEAGIIFGVMPILSAAICFFLPETKGTELPSTLEDALNRRNSNAEKENI